MPDHEEPDATARPEIPEHRVTVQNIVDWQKIRSQHDEYAKDPHHMLVHLLKCIGPISATLEHRDHEEDEPDVASKRYADLIISAIWLVESMGEDAAELVANRIWEIGIRPKRDELPPGERDSDKEGET